MKNVKVSKKEVQEVIETLKNGDIYQNDVAGYFFRLRNGVERIAIINGEYKFYKNLERFATKIAQMVKAG